MRMGFMDRLSELALCGRDESATDGERGRSTAKCRRATYVGVEWSQQTSSHGRGLWRSKDRNTESEEAFGFDYSFDS